MFTESSWGFTWENLGQPNTADGAADSAWGYADAVTLHQSPVPGASSTESSWGFRSTPVGIVVTTLPDLTNVEPELAVTISATVMGGRTADSWVWRQVSGPSVSLSPTNSVCSFRPPSILNQSGTPQPTQITLGVTAVIAGKSSAEEIFDVYSLPQLEWMYVNGEWLGKRPIIQQ